MIRSAVCALLLLAASTSARAQVVRVVTLADSLVGAVGGIAVDRMGDVYSADFRDSVWRIASDGRVTKFADGFYGASGNFFDARGNLLQSSFYGNYISRIDRTGRHEVMVKEGLSGPVGITVTGEGSIFVTNCSSNSIAQVDEEAGVAREFSSGDLYACPNGITSGPDGTLYVVNFSNGNVLRLGADGEAEVLANIPGPGNGHIAFARGSLYVTAFQSHQIYRVSLDGEVAQVAGSAQPGEIDGSPEEARFTFPNGIAVAPSGDRLFVNDFINRSPPTLDIRPVPLASVRLIKLANLAELMVAGLRSGGVEGLKAVHQAYKQDPATAGQFTQVQLNALGYQLMQGGNLDAAIAVFELNAKDYPESFNPHDSLGEAYLAAGRTDEAVASYRRSLELNPDNTNARDVLARLENR